MAEPSAPLSAEELAAIRAWVTWRSDGFPLQGVEGGHKAWEALQRLAKPYKGWVTPDAMVFVLLAEIDRLRTNREVVAATAYESGYQAAVREGEAREGRLVFAARKLDGALALTHPKGPTAQDAWDELATARRELRAAIAEAREALAAGSEGARDADG